MAKKVKTVVVNFIVILIFPAETRTTLGKVFVKSSAYKTEEFHIEMMGYVYFMSINFLDKQTSFPNQPTSQTFA